ncbi:HIT family protein [Bacillus coahuilensis]|uniref:HIT family protein n=1 Tax=Bacillus coahuilensis TaxID=408580 RepID=UPI0007506DDD|nr:HIT domain-containing protein [Bacillus coahuilensis]
MKNLLKIYTTENITLSHASIDSNILGYIYLEPRSHVEKWDELNPKIYEEILLLTSLCDSFLTKFYGCERLYSVVISEKVKHLHYHLIPRYSYSKVRGVELIEQATAQKAIGTEPRITSEQINKLIGELNLYIKKEIEKRAQ